MGLITEQGMERLSFGSRLLRRCSTPFDFFLQKGKVSPEVRQDFIKGMVGQLVARRKQLGLVGLDVDDMLGCADYLTAKWECGMRTPSAFNLMCWAEALGCRWVLVPNPETKQTNSKQGNR
jgi:hypothetical protein